MIVKVDLPDEVYRAYLVRARKVGAGDVSGYVRRIMMAPFWQPKAGGRPRVLTDVRRIEELRRKGFSWREVGARLGISSSGAYKAWQRHQAEEGSRNG